MAEGRGFELVGRWAGVISRRDTAALRGAGEANGASLDPGGGPLLGHRAACYGLAQPFEKPLQLGLAVYDTPDPIGQLLDVVPWMGHVLPQPGEQPDEEGGEAEEPAKLDCH